MSVAKTGEHCPVHGSAILEPWSLPNNGARWCPECERRCAECGADESERRLTPWHDNAALGGERELVCGPCGGSRLGC